MRMQLKLKNFNRRETECKKCLLNSVQGSVMRYVRVSYNERASIKFESIYAIT